MCLIVFLPLFSYIPSSPGRLVEDIAEIMKKEQTDDTTMDSMYETDTSTVVPNAKAQSRIADGTMIDHRQSSMREPPKKAKKSLENSWNNSDIPYIIETPVSILYYLINCI